MKNQFVTVRWPRPSHASPYGFGASGGETVTTGLPATPLLSTGKTSMSPPGLAPPLVFGSATASAVPSGLNAIAVGEDVCDVVRWCEPAMGVKAHPTETVKP